MICLVSYEVRSGMLNCVLKRRGDMSSIHSEPTPRMLIKRIASIPPEIAVRTPMEDGT